MVSMIKIALFQALYGDMPTKKTVIKKPPYADTAVSTSPNSGSWPAGRSPLGRRGPEDTGGGNHGNPKPHPGMNPGMMPAQDPDLYNTVNPGFPIWPDVWEPPFSEPAYNGGSPSPAAPDICLLDKIDAITMNIHGETFVFKGTKTV